MMGIFNTKAAIENNEYEEICISERERVRRAIHLFYTFMLTLGGSFEADNLQRTAKRQCGGLRVARVIAAL